MSYENIPVNEQTRLIQLQPNQADRLFELSEKLRDAGLYDDFDAVVLSDEVGIVKPSPAIYEEVINKLGVLPTECIYIDDIEKNLLPARGMGMTTVLANNSPVDTMSKIRSLLSF